VARSRHLAPTFHPRLNSNVEVLREAHRYIGGQAATGYDVSPAAEWLLDNFHLIEAQLAPIREGLPRRYFRELPVLVEPPLAGLPRVYGVAWAFVAHTDGDFDEDLLATYLCAYQETRELHLSEMWALPTTLRVVLIENLRRLAERVACNKAAREAANLCCERLDRLGVAELEQVLLPLERRGVGRMFLAQMALRLQDRLPDAGTGLRPEHLAWLQRALPDAAAQHAQHGADQAADNLSVRNAVNSLREIGDADWADIVARTSALMQSMLRSPVFEAEHATTRDETLHGIERLARRSGLAEGAVARRLLDLMASADPDDPLSGVPGHWLTGGGRPALLRVLGLQERGVRAWRAFAAPLALPAFLAGLLLATLGLLAWLVEQLAPLAAAPRLGVALLLAFPASEAVVAVINRLISESARPRPLPRLALREGIPAEHRVLVAVPALLSSAASVKDLLHRLELHHLANPEREAQFALLSDDVDADAERVDGDAALLAAATRGIDALNARYPGPPGAAPRFVVLHRGRRFSETEQRWIGWERKRGKLEQLIAALAQGVPGPFVELGQASRLAEATRYVVTLDSDTQLPPGSLRALVGVAAHPRNRPRLDIARGRIDAGYGILQPRILTPLPARRELTHFHALFAGQCGLDPYSTASSEVYQDLFGEGSFSGKGLLDVQAVHAVLAQRLPEGLVLSHDLFEGSLARCAAVTDIGLVEAAPFHADVAASRVHRWTRGDWQLLPLLLSPRRYRLRAVNRWKMLDNLRRSLVAPASLALVVLSLAGWALAPAVALGLVFAAFAAGPVLGALAGLWPRSQDFARGHFLRHAGAGLMRAVSGGLWHLAQLQQQGRQQADAIGRALWRMGVSRRLLLQWTTAATAQAQATTRPGLLLRRHAAEPALALLLTAGLLAAGTPHAATTVALGLLWAASPLWTWWASRPRSSRADAALPAAAHAYLEGVARDTWRYFERCVNADENHLPPDNLQTLPHEMLAHRTSPTNIGLYLLSAACAREFGWIGTAELLQRLEATLDTLDTLQRHRGHFLNWYDTQTGAPLLPKYVSTVDSGNLGGHLLAVGQACLSFARPAPGTHEDAGEECTDGADGFSARLRAVAARCTGLAWAADYRCLYHPRRHLFHIGYRVAEQALDAGFYDLLASESRLTSLLAIAKGDVPVGHWAALGRPFFGVGAMAGLRSWSGSMFEYLMPSLLVDEPEGSVLRDAGLAALREQIAFARAHRVPWGISESAYAGRDHTLAYQYAPQGVPRLALRRTPPDELVIAPYATALAAQLAPRRAVANLAALQGLGARGSMGFIEALDYTPSRSTLDEPFTPVATSMAHHQGMTIVALANVLRDGVVRRWAMAEPRLEAMVPLLHERAPREVPRLRAPLAGPLPQALRRRAPGLLRPVQPGAAAVEPTQLLSNGRYRVTLRANGAGWSRWGPVGIHRWRDDALRDALGSFFYLRRAAGADLVSLTQHPAPDPDAAYGSTFHADRVCLEATWPDLQAQVTVWVSPEDDIEFRQVELRNLGEATLDLELISAFELALAEPRADEAHPAFSKLFVHASWRAAMQAMVFERRPRLAGERAVMAAHFLAASDPPVQAVRVQADRQRWLGRNRGASRPLAAFDAAPVAQGDEPATMDTGLDPVCAISLRVRILPGAKALLTFATAATDNGGVLSAVIDKYRQPVHVQRASLMSATLTGIRLRALGIGANDFAAIQTLTSALVQTLTVPELPAGDPAGSSGIDRRLLWRFGISGDRPIVLVSAQAAQGQGLLRSLALALRLWSWGGVGCDLVVLNAEPVSYAMALQHELQGLRQRHDAETAAQGGDACTGFFVLQTHEVTAEERATLHGLARVRLVADGRPLPLQVQGWLGAHEAAFERRHELARSALPAASGPAGPAPAPRGRFAADGAAFVFEAGEASRPTRPWVNVIANDGFGTLLSEAGGGHTWAGNSRLNQLTAWSNDAVADPPSEWLLLQDLRTRQVWSATASGGTVVDGEPVVYRVTHGQGWSRITHRRGDAEVTLTWCVDPVLAIKQLQVDVANRGSQALRLRVAGIAEWAMGAGCAARATVHTARLRQRLPEGRVTALLCTQREASGGFGDGTAFLAIAHTPVNASGTEDDWTCDRRELFDARGRLVLPDHLGQLQGAGLDPCAALAVRLDIAAGASAACVFLLGHAASPDAARNLATRAAAVPPDQRLHAARSAWDTLLQATTVATPDPLFDALVNRWLPYQTVSCRLWAKAGFYQAGGATGFRDQLQDAMALALAAPHLLRAQILLAASRQFPEGDVQHWWHAPGGAGVRTHFSDDLLWLPKACAHYLAATGDATLLSETVPFIEGPAVPPGAEDAYATPTVSALTATVYEHAARTIDRSLRVGAHGLPLMGSGDWNDAMNRVGHEGRGESVWLGWFLCTVVAEFAPIARTRGETQRAGRWEAAAQGWQRALRGPAWDGAWFRRAFFDDGSPLGSQSLVECRIDLIAQAWAVLSGVATWPQQVVAMAAVDAQLADAQAGLLRLLDPPMQHAQPSAGYIQAYPPGVRENGGQYSHGAVWALMAQARMFADHGHPDSGEAAWRYFTWLSPAHRAADPQQGAAYGLEPYVMAGDVYTQPPYVGRGGWSWYTGAAAWMHRAAIESILGLGLDAGTLCLRPCLPAHWPRAELSLLREGRRLRFVLLRGGEALARREAAACGATMLRPGEPLAWRDLPLQANFVVPLAGGAS